MEKRYAVCLPGGSDFAVRAGVCTQIEGHDWAREAAAGRPAPIQGLENRDYSTLTNNLCFNSWIVG
jgi:hypothetical protein